MSVGRGTSLRYVMLLQISSPVLYINNYLNSECVECFASFVTLEWCHIVDEMGIQRDAKYTRVAVAGETPLVHIPGLQ